MEKITVLPYAGPEIMENEWKNPIGSCKAGKRINGRMVPIYNPYGECGKTKTRKGESK